MGRRLDAGLRFLLLVAAREVFPGERLVVEHARSHGYFACLEGRTLDAAGVARIRGRMRTWVERNEPFRSREMSGREAAETLAADGQEDKAPIVRRLPTVTLYYLGQTPCYLHGGVPATTGELRGFSVVFERPGLLVNMPGRRVTNSRKLVRVYEQSERWARILECGCAADINRLTRQGRLPDFIAVNEAFHEKNIAMLADRITQGGKRVVLIAGPSSSGKTTFAKRLAVQLMVNGQKPLYLSTDDYFIDRDQVPVGPDGRRDFEDISVTNVALLVEQLNLLLGGEAVRLPYYDFLIGKSQWRQELSVAQGPILVEGLHALNPAVTGAFPAASRFLIYINALSMLNLDDTTPLHTADGRLMRRIVRDARNRGHSVEQTLLRWPSVMAGERKFITPYRDRADALFNSSLFYEPAVLRDSLLPLLDGIPESSPVAEEAKWLAYVLRCFESASSDAVPSGSLLREFIGSREEISAGLSAMDREEGREDK